MTKEMEVDFREAANFILGEFEKTIKAADPNGTEMFGATLSKDQLLSVYNIAANLMLAEYISYATRILEKDTI